MLPGRAPRPDLINKPSGGSNVLQIQPLVDSKEAITSSDVGALWGQNMQDGGAVAQGIALMRPEILQQHGWAPVLQGTQQSLLLTGAFLSTLSLLCVGQHL